LLLDDSFFIACIDINNLLFILIYNLLGNDSCIIIPP